MVTQLFEGSRWCFSKILAHFLANGGAVKDVMGDFLWLGWGFLRYGVFDFGGAFYDVGGIF